MSVEWSVRSRVEVSCARAGDVDDRWSLGRVVYEIEGDFPSRDVRISFLPKRPWSSLLTERPMLSDRGWKGCELE